MFFKIDYYTFIFSSYTLFLVIFNIIFFFSMFTFNLFLLITCLSCIINIYINIYINYINLSLKNNKPGIYSLLNIGTKIVFFACLLIFADYLLKILLELFNILKVITRGGSNTDYYNTGPSNGGNKPNGPSGGGGSNNNTNVLSSQDYKKAKKRERDRVYGRSIKGKEAQARYRNSEKGKANKAKHKAKP